MSFTNELLGPDWEAKVAQRRDARFINSAMMATLGGAVVSDGLEDGRVVSGVGGQYNFVAQAHDLPGGRSIIAVRATRASGGTLESNIRWNYGHETIPRHLRDIVLTEYGIADIRGRSDAEVAAAMIEIADSRFQAGLVADAKRAGKLPQDYVIPERCLPQPARGTRTGARAAPCGRPLRIPALRHGFQPGGDPPRRGAARTQGALGDARRKARDRGDVSASAAARCRR